MTKGNRVKIWEKYDKHCAYCGCEIAYKDMQVDHIIPKSLGGLDDMTNYNPSCRGCNFYKSTFSVDQFRERLATLHNRLFKLFIVRMAIRFGILHYTQGDIRFYFEQLSPKI